MLANKNIFCNSPWFEIHIYWDGSFGICCQESHKLYPENHTEYNIKTMTIMDWFNSDPVKNFRTKLLKDSKLSECHRCMISETNNGNSRRIQINQKSVIFTRTAFEPSFQQSPGYKHFKHSNKNQGHTDTYPIDIHVDLGNYCNLACKMCQPSASSTIASQHVQWGIKEDKKFLGVDWTKDQKVWDNFKQQILSIPNFNNIHFMGGETILTDRFEDLIDTLIDNKRFDMCLSFVTNGTMFKPNLIEKLKKFRRVGIEVSIETLDERNNYIRQGTDTKQVLANISRYVEHCNNNSITLTLRPAPSLLSVGYYVDLLQYALDNHFIVKSNLCYKPSFLRIENLPSSVKDLYKEKYLNFLKQFNTPIKIEHNASNLYETENIVREQAELCLSLLNQPQPDNVDIEYKKLVQHCSRWDNIYNLNARNLYPELTELWNQYGY